MEPSCIIMSTERHKIQQIEGLNHQASFSDASMKFFPISIRYRYDIDEIS